MELGVPISAGGPSVSHLLYADDILFFAGASIPNVKKINAILEDYCSWTGQRVNNGKSAILFSKRTSSTTRSRLAKMIGCCKVAEMEYLGVKLALRRLSRKDFTPLIQKARACTLSWGIRHLSLAGQVTLINSVLLPLSVYMVTHTGVQRAVLNDIEKICHSFFWDRHATHKSMHYTSWESMVRPRCKGGLGFHTGDNWVGPLRARITWEFICKPLELFQKYMRHKYGDNPWHYDGRKGSSICWKIICEGAHFILKGIGWNRPKLLLCFGELLVDIICGISIENGLSTYSIEMVKSPLGSTISTMVYNSCFMEDDDPICLIFKIRMRPRKKLFWWRLYKDNIPTNGWLCRRCLSADSSCPLGCGEVEDINHITCNCKKLRDVLTVLENWGLVVPRFCSFDELWDSIGKFADMR
ncbi:uncharacterized protein LOC110112019 [Dendrobium catenatum]|uniref:uncharacterized protein LOC110112019 n=1 Tax=Dendrobium catenatum TaxID=906689 RepID=UPI0009F24BD5|nr:uncharacterized protein LOC110112019 [Dendrobium catenatum]